MRQLLAFMSALLRFGLVSVTVGLLLCAAASATSVALFWWAASRARAVAAIAADWRRGSRADRAGRYDAGMHLTPWEEERLLIFSAAELARRHRSSGLQLNAPEAVALICDAMLEAARAGASYQDVEAAGRAAVALDDVLPGVREIVDEVHLEVLMGDGARLVLLLDPLAGHRPPTNDGPGAIRPAQPDAALAAPPVRETLEVEVRSESRRVIRVSSHYPFDRVNARLVFDRAAAHGFRLDLPAGATERWGPGETKTVRLVRFAGDRDAGVDT